MQLLNYIIYDYGNNARERDYLLYDFKYPVIVFDGKMYAAELRKGEIEIDECDHVVLEQEHVDRELWGHESRTFYIDVVTKKALPTLADAMRKDVFAFSKLFVEGMEGGLNDGLPRVLPEYKTIVRTRILETARTIFRENGYGLTTMDDIARKLGISKAALYTYFRAKEELFRAAYESSPREVEKLIQWVVSQGDTRKAFSTFFDEMMPSTGRISGLDFEVVAEATRNPELRGVLKAHYDQYIDAVQHCVEATSKHSRKGQRDLAGAIMALWYGMETPVALGYPIREVKDMRNGAMERLLGP
jgi:AcrR family transcriptional regulator